MTNSRSEFHGWFSNLKHLAEVDKVTRFGHWEWDIEKDHLFWPQQVYDILGINHNEKVSAHQQATYSSYLACIHPEDRQIVNTAMATALKNRQTFDITHRVVLKNQSIRFIRTHAEIRCDKNNMPLRMVGIVHDITELLLFMDEQSRLNTMVQGSHEFIATFDAEGKILFANHALKNVTQMVCFQDCLSTEDKRYFEQEIMPEVNQSGSWEGENELQCRQGEKHYSLPVAQHIVKHQVESMGMQYFSTFMHDLSKNKEVERVRKEAQEKAEITATEEAALGSLLTISLQPSSIEEYLQKVTVVLVTSVSWLQLLPKVGIFLTQEGKHGTVLKLAENYQLHKELINLCDEVEYGQCLCGRAAQTQEIVYADCIDERHDISYPGIEPHGHYCVPIMQDDKVLGVLALYLPEHHQVSQRELDFLQRIADVMSMGIRRRYDNLELIKEKEKAQAADKAKSEFIANISHELRTPMHGILGMAELLSESPLNDEQQQFLTSITSAGKSLLTIINDILEFSNVESGMTTLHKAPLNLLHLGQAAISEHAERAELKNIPIRFEYPKVFPEPLMGDEKLIQKVLSNLISNAVKFSTQGEVVVRLELIRQQLEQVYIRFSVQDSGIGIEPTIQKSLFSRFSQGDASITRHHGGIGLGLTICKKLLELMGSTIDYTSTPNEGSRFWFDLNLYVAPGVKLTTPQSQLETRNEEQQYVIDMVHLNAMQNLLDEDFPEFTNAFINVVRQNLDEYSQAVLEKDDERLLRIAQNVKASADNIGARTLSKAAKHMHELIKNGEYSHMEKSNEIIHQQFNQCVKELEQFRC